MFGSPNIFTEDPDILCHDDESLDMELRQLRAVYATNDIQLESYESP